MRLPIHALLILAVFAIFPQLNFAQPRWQMQASGEIVWNVKDNDGHSDHIEQSGQYISCVLRYGVTKERKFKLSSRTIVWPMLRKIPNNTRGGLIERFSQNFLENTKINGVKIGDLETVESLKLDGTVCVKSSLNLGDKVGKVELVRTFFPSPTLPVFCEIYEFKNLCKNTVSLDVAPINFQKKTEAKNGVDGNVYLMNGGIDKACVGQREIKSGESFRVFASISAIKDGELPVNFSYLKEEADRRKFVQKMWKNLVLETPNETINRMFAFAKIRGAESIYKTAGGFMHGPGGENYYAAIWANDQAEYINPFFPFLGYDIANESAFNSFKHWLRFINPQYKPIPASIIAEGKDHWSVAGDRGDAAMVAYGAARYALARADKKEAEEIFKLVKWCLEYCQKKIIEGGVVSSRSDELEGRFPSGKANLCTSSLYCDALLSAAYLARELDMPKDIISDYETRAQEMRKNIESYFGANVEGFETYKYYETNTVLRSWICIPLTIGIYDRKDGTISALFSNRLWTENGLLTQAGDKTFWDRSTLYALRGAFACGAQDIALKYLQSYSEKRLLGEHVPYAIEAWPEGGQRHLSAESDLYCRIITEGLFGIRPTGFDSFDLTIRLPKDWQEMSLKNIFAFSKSGFDIFVKRANKKLQIKILQKSKPAKTYNIKDGETISVKL